MFSTLTYDLKAARTRLVRWGCVLLFFLATFAPSATAQKLDSGKIFGTMGTLTVPNLPSNTNYSFTLNEGTEFDLTLYEKISLKENSSETKDKDLVIKKPSDSNDPSKSDYYKKLQDLCNKLKNYKQVEITFDKSKDDPSKSQISIAKQEAVTPAANQPRRTGILESIGTTLLSMPRIALFIVFLVIIGFSLSLDKIIRKEKSFFEIMRSFFLSQNEGRNSNTGGTRELVKEISAENKTVEIFRIIRNIEKSLMDPIEDLDGVNGDKQEILPLPTRFKGIETSIRELNLKLNEDNRLFFDENNNFLPALTNNKVFSLQKDIVNEIENIVDTLKSFSEAFNNKITKTDAENPSSSGLHHLTSDDLNLLDKISREFPEAMKNAHHFFPPAETRSLNNVLGIVNGPSFESKAKTIRELVSSLTSVYERVNSTVDRLERARDSINQLQGFKPQDELGKWKIVAGEISNSLESIKSNLIEIGPQGKFAQCKVELDAIDSLLEESMIKSASIGTSFTTILHDDKNFLSKLEYIESDTLPRLEKRLEYLNESLAAVIVDQNALLSPPKTEEVDEEVKAPAPIPRELTWQWPFDISFEDIKVEEMELLGDLKESMASQTGQAERWLRERHETVSRFIKVLEFVQERGGAGLKDSPQALNELADSVFDPRYFISLMSLELDTINFSQLHLLEMRLDNMRLNLKTYLKQRFGLYPVAAPIGEKAYNSDWHTDDGKFRIWAQDPSQHNILERQISYGFMLNGQPIMKARVYRYFDESENHNATTLANERAVNETPKAHEALIEGQDEQPSLIPGFMRQ